VSDLVEDAWHHARARYPDVDIALATYRSHVAARTTTPEDCCLDDLYLACACTAGDPAAVRAFDREIMPFVDAVLARWRTGLADDTRQRLLAMFAVDHANRGPLLATYTGRGALRRWVRVIAAREAGRTSQAEAATVNVDDDELLDLLAPPGDPALSAIKNEAAAAFTAAFTAALAELEPRERTALRLHVLDGLTIDEIAPMYSVHRATVARWVAAAKQAVLDRTRRRLMHDLRLGPVEVDSLINLVHSRIDLADEPWLRGE